MYIDIYIFKFKHIILNLFDSIGRQATYRKQVVLHNRENKNGQKDMKIYLKSLLFKEVHIKLC